MVPRLLTLLLAVVAPLGAAQRPASEPQDELTELSLEELMGIEVHVTSVSRKEESRERTAAAIHVLTREDIRRSGATSLPEALRHVPGLHVARLSSGGYAISARGFASEFANKMLVLIDGRSVYFPLFAGVYWQNQQVLLEDVERIEVILGPGGAMWGANAVNGVINVITKSAADTQGTYASTLLGVHERAGAELRSGVALGRDAHLRVWGRHAQREGLEPAPGYGDEEFRQLQGGFRADWGAPGADAWTLSGDAFDNVDQRDIQTAVFGPPYVELRPLDGRHQGGNLLARWTRPRADGTSMSLQGYYDRFELGTSLTDYQLGTFDLDFQDRRRLSERHELSWGLGYRHTDSDSQGTELLSFSPAERHDDLFSAFVLDEVRPSERWTLSLGAKLEHNDYSGLELQPSGRFSFHATEHGTLWGAVSRAVRTPSQAEDGIRFVTGVDPFLVGGFDTALILTGNEDFDPEELTAYELGYRFQTGPRVTWDLALFVNDYDRLSTLGIGLPTPGGPTGMFLPITFENGAAGQTWGGELSLNAALSEDWTVGAGISHIQFALDGETDTAVESVTPTNQLFLESSHDLGADWEADGTLWWVDDLSGGVSDYARLDLRLGWRVSEHFRLTFGAQGLFHDDEPEFPDDYFGAYYGNRTAGYVKLELSF